MKKTKIDQLKLQLETKNELDKKREEGKIIALRKGNQFVEIDLTLLNKTKANQVKAIKKAFKGGELKYMPNGKGDLLLIYPKRHSGFFTRTITSYSDAILIDSPDEDKLSKFNMRLRNIVPKLNNSLYMEALSWVNYANSINMKIPRGWELLDKRWTKTVKIMRVSEDLYDFYNIHDYIPNPKILRTLVNNIRPEFGETKVYTSKLLAMTKLVNAYKANEGLMKTDSNVTVLYQEGGHGMIPGTRISDSKGNTLSDIPTVLECKDVVCKQHISSEGDSLIVYIDNTRGQYEGVYKKDKKSNIPMKTLKKMAQSVAVSLQYPMAYTEWK